jgi:membrane protein CcdC involved in cytochrome C biogenesis
MFSIDDKQAFKVNIKHFTLLFAKWIFIIIAIKLWGSDSLELANLLKAAAFVIFVSLALGLGCAFYVNHKEKNNDTSE